MYISHSVMDRLGVKATNSKAKARGVKAKAKDLAPEPKAKAKDTPAGLEAPRGQGRGLDSRTPSLECAGKTVKSLENTSYLSASEVMIHYEEVLYQVYAPLPLLLRYHGK